MENKFKTFLSKIASNAVFITGILLGFGWIIYQSLADDIGFSFEGVINDIGFAIVVVCWGVLFGILISNGGYKSAKETDEFQLIAKEKTEAIKKGNPEREEIVCYTKDIAKNNQKEARREVLESFGLNYEEFFDNDGKLASYDYKKDKTLSRKQKKSIKYCINRIPIYIPNIFGSISGKLFGIRKRKTQAGFEAKNDIKNTIIRAIFTIFTVGITFTIKWNIEGLIKALIQVSMWTASGVVQRIANYNFIINEIMPQLVEDTLIIEGYLSLSDEEKMRYKDKVIEEKAKRSRLKLEVK